MGLISPYKYCKRNVIEINIVTINVEVGSSASKTKTHKPELHLAIIS